MATKLDKDLQKRNRKYWLLALLLIPLFCAFFYFTSPSDESYYKKLDKQSPRPTEIHVSRPIMIANALSHLTFGLVWVDENTLSVFDDANKEDIAINIKTKEVVHEKHPIDNEEETYVKVFEPTGKNKIVATCPKENLAIRGGSTQWGQYVVKF